MGVLSMASIALVAGYTPEPTRLRMHQDTQAKVGYIGTVLKDRQLLRLNWGIFVLQAGLMAMFTVLPFALRELGWDKAEHWKVYLPATVIGLALMVPAIIIGETRNKLKPVFILGIGLVLASQAALIFSLGSVWTIGVALVVYFIGFNILEASMPSLVSKIAPANLKGTAMGVYNTMQSLGLFTGGMMGSRAVLRPDGVVAGVGMDGACTAAGEKRCVCRAGTLAGAVGRVAAEIAGCFGRSGREFQR